MSDRLWPQFEEHPSSSVLLLHVEGELEGREAAVVRQHLADCWDCRVLCEELGKGIHAYVVARRDVLVPRLPPSPARHHFMPRLNAEAGLPESGIFGRLAALIRHLFEATPRVGWPAGAVSVLMSLVILYIYVIKPPAMTAAAFFERVHQAGSSQKLPVQYVAVQKIRVLQGNREVERQILHHSLTVASRQSSPEPAWMYPLELAQIDWNNPLSADQFERWHSLQSIGLDSVTRSGEAVTLTTKLPPGYPIVRASLTVRSADWHAVAERFEFADQAPLEVREISFEIRATISATPEPRSEFRPPSAARPDLAVNHLPVIDLVRPPVLPSDGDLERSEIALREAMHRLDADRNEVPRIIRENHRLVIQALAETPERQRELAAAVGGIPYITPEFAAVSTPATTAAPLPTSSGPLPPSYNTTPPLAKALWDYKGGMDVANDYLEMVRESYFRVLADANALDRLGRRYPLAESDRLPADVRTRVDSLASDYIRAIQKSAPEFLRQLSDPVDEMLRRSDIPGQVPFPAGASSGCASWHDLTPRFVADLQQEQISFRRLFVVDQTSVPLSLSADGLLSQVVQVRARLSREIEQLCLP